MEFHRKAGSDKWTYTHENWTLEVKSDGKIRAYMDEESIASFWCCTCHVEVFIGDKGISVYGTKTYDGNSHEKYDPVIPWEVIEAIMFAKSRKWDFN